MANVTHYPSRNGPVCGFVGPNRAAPNDARDYDPLNPTCEACKKWLEAAQGVTARMKALPEQFATPSKGKPRATEPKE